MGSTPLFCAAERGHVEVVRELVKSEAIDLQAVNESNNESTCGYTAFHMACALDNVS